MGTISGPEQVSGQEPGGATNKGQGQPSRERSSGPAAADRSADPAAMSTSPVTPEDIRAAAEVQQELGPEYSDAVVAAFIARIDREVAARVQARLAGTSGAKPAKPASRRTLLKGMAIGACAGALITGVVVGLPGGPAQQNTRVTPHSVGGPRVGPEQGTGSVFVRPGGAGGHRIPVPPAPPSG